MNIKYNYKSDWPSSQKKKPWQISEILLNIWMSNDITFRR
jgi:hypothetical protein